MRGNARTQGETRRKEKDNIFGSGSRAPIAISLLVKNPKSKQRGQVFFHDIGDYLSREEKLKAIQDYASIAGITAANGWQSITPDDHGDWLQQRDDSFSQFIVLGDKKKNETGLFENFSLGVVTNRDVWCYNSSLSIITENMQRMINFYNTEVFRFDTLYKCFDKKERGSKIESFIDTNPTKISWTRSLKQFLVKNYSFYFDEKSLIHSQYRPFTRQWLYFNRTFNEMVYQMPRIFPEPTSENIIISVSGAGAKNGISCFISSTILDLNCLEAGAQCFPLYLYDDPSETKAPSQSQGSLFDAPAPEPKQRTRRDAITDEGLQHFQSAYPGEKISKEDLFYYIYGLLHSEQYREWYADNLAKELPRIPRVKLAADFWAFSKAGRELAKLHIGYESVEPYPATVGIAGGKTLDDCTPQDFRVEKMRYGKNGKEKDLTTLHYNSKITVTGIPPEAYEYVVNGKPALDWVVERQCVKTDKDSGIVNDANDWANETMHNPRYPLELFLRVITVSLETLKIVKALPKLEKAELS
ncbi:type ISP restriction/modification enzyme [Desulfovibrio sp.]|uniref:type ISP restriction/modification enzyme n=1 Tax=Desulfovibrio sp. TaxID=885 RepID=UPI0035B12FC3